jgi:hypothetical protein
MKTISTERKPRAPNDAQSVKNNPMITYKVEKVLHTDCIMNPQINHLPEKPLIHQQQRRLPMEPVTVASKENRYSKRRKGNYSLRMR